MWADKEEGRKEGLQDRGGVGKESQLIGQMLEGS